MTPAVRRRELVGRWLRTVLVYLMGDNDLESFAVGDVFEMAEAGSNENAEHRDPRRPSSRLLRRGDRSARQLRRHHAGSCGPRGSSRPLILAS